MVFFTYHQPLVSDHYAPLVLKGLTDTKIKEIERTIEEHDLEEKEERTVRCKACRHTICSLTSVIEVNGRHGHTFYNPEGIIYHIGCFGSAPGCIVQGEPTLHFTWFAGYNWSFAICANCFVHLGWHYQSGSGENFYGLILKKLVEGR